MENYESMTSEELEAEKQRLDEQRQAIKAEMLAIQRVLDKRATEEAVQRKLATLSHAERAALAQRITAEGISSAAEVGTPGQ